jgi:hypothetical protein
MPKRFTMASLLGGAAVSAVLVNSFALTASNTVPTSSAGAGSGAISGYAVSSIHYNLNATNPQNIDSVTFNVDVAPPAGSTLKAKLVAAGSTYYSCTNTGTAVTCTTTSPQATVAASDQLLVVAAQ